ncbi:MAG TPA: hypothetical protein VGH57_31850, partial [Amycolatopsis sp.]
MPVSGESSPLGGSTAAGEDRRSAVSAVTDPDGRRREFDPSAPKSGTGPAAAPIDATASTAGADSATNAAASSGTATDTAASGTAAATVASSGASTDAAS